MAADPRVDRLRASVLALPTAALRDAVRAIPEPTVAALPARARPLVAQLRRANNPADLLRRLPDLQVIALLADGLSDDCLHAIRDHLGDAADDPTREQLVAAVDAVLEDFDVETVRVMLATVAVGQAEAADLCDALLTEDERFAVTLPESAPIVSTRTPKPPASDEIKERRRERKEAERARKARDKAAAAKPLRPKPRPTAIEAPTPAATEAPPPAEPPPPPAPETPRRPAVLTPQQERRFDPEHALVGTVVLAEVRFDEVDPEHPHLDRKHRPCVVIGVAQHSLLVRPAYSEGGLQSREWTSYQLKDWRQAGLDKASWIDSTPHVVPRRTAEHEFGRLSADDWNALW